MESNNSEFYQSFADGLRSVFEMKSAILEFYYNDDELQKLISWSRDQSTFINIEDQVAQSMGLPVKPLQLIEDNCRKTAEDLAQSSVVLCVYGNVNVGKSTCCNLLLGQDLLHVTNVQCTAVNTVVSSNHHVGNAKVIFNETIDIKFVFYMTW